MLQAKPGAYLFMPAAMAATAKWAMAAGLTLHNPSYGFNDDLIRRAFWVRLAEEWLASPGQVCLERPPTCPAVD